MLIKVNITLYSVLFFNLINFIFRDGLKFLFYKIENKLEKIRRRKTPPLLTVFFYETKESYQTKGIIL